MRLPGCCEGRLLTLPSVDGTIKVRLHRVKWKAQRPRVRKACRQREREAEQGATLSAQRDS